MHLAPSRPPVRDTHLVPIRACGQRLPKGPPYHVNILVLILEGFGDCRISKLQRGFGGERKMPSRVCEKHLISGPSSGRERTCQICQRLSSLISWQVTLYTDFFHICQLLQDNRSPIFYLIKSNGMRQFYVSHPIQCLYSLLLIYLYIFLALQISSLMETSPLLISSALHLVPQPLAQPTAHPANGLCLQRPQPRQHIYCVQTVPRRAVVTRIHLPPALLPILKTPIP